MKTAIITGAASGLGRELAIQLKSTGYTLCLWDIQQLPLEALAKELSADFTVIDISKNTEIVSAFAHFQNKHSTLDIFINCAGISITGAAQNLEEADWERILNINLKGSILCATTALRQMQKQKHGKIVNIASIFGLIPAPSAIAYATSKHALVGFSKTLEIEARSDGVEVYTICPGFIQSPFFQNAHYIGVSKDTMLQKQPPSIPVKIAANQIMTHIHGSKHWLIFPFSAKFLIFLDKYLPWLSYKLLSQSWNDFQNISKIQNHSTQNHSTQNNSHAE